MKYSKKCPKYFRYGMECNAFSPNGFLAKVKYNTTKNITAVGTPLGIDKIKLFIT